MDYMSDSNLSSRFSTKSLGKWRQSCSELCFLKNTASDFPRGAVVKNPRGNAGDTGLSPGPGRFHMPWSN